MRNGNPFFKETLLQKLTAVSLGPDKELNMKSKQPVLLQRGTTMRVPVWQQQLSISLKYTEPNSKIHLFFSKAGMVRVFYGNDKLCKSMDNTYVSYS